MRTRKGEKRSRAGESVSVLLVDADEQRRRIHAAIARRAYEFFESGAPEAEEHEDWRRAEMSLMRPLCLGRMDLNDSYWISANAQSFQEGTIQIWVAPRHLTICGKQKPREGAFEKSRRVPVGRDESIFRQVGLPVEIDPSQVRATIKGKCLEIVLRKVQSTLDQKARAAAA